MHRHDASIEVLTQAILRYAVERMRLDPPPLDGSRSRADLRRHGRPHDHARTASAASRRCGCSATCWRRRASASTTRGSCRFVPAAPTEASILFDLVVGASSIYAGSWLEGAGAVYAENEALRWIADLAGLPPSAGGVFVSGGTAGNLSALIAARGTVATPSRRRHRPHPRPDHRVERCPLDRSPRPAGRWTPTSSPVPADEQGRLHGRGARTPLWRRSTPTIATRVFAIVATCGTTNAGVIDDLAGVADGVRARTACGCTSTARTAVPGLAAPSVRSRYAGIERADSFIVDPHKWLFAPFDCCALVYRDPYEARAAHTQHAEYLDVLHADDQADATSGTRATSPTTCRGGRVACRSGSASPPTAPTPTATPSRPRCRSPARAAD